MKLHELIEKLSKMPQDAEVLLYKEISYYGDSGYEPISDIELKKESVFRDKRIVEHNVTFIAIK